MSLHERTIRWLFLAAAIVVAMASFLFFWEGFEPAPAPPPPAEEPEPEPEGPRELAPPIHPVEPLEMEPVEGELVELPPLDESDSYFAMALVEVFGEDIEAMLSDVALIDKTVASVDNLARGRVAEKVRPVGRIAGSFDVVAAAENGPFYMSSDNFARYDGIVNMMTSADLDQLVATYRRFYPLIQEAYVRLGYPESYFNDRAVAVIDEMLATPEPEQPIQLVRPHVLYEYADPDLEGLSAGQKLLLRMGPDHAGRVKAVLTDIRQRIAQSP